jgi:hypothetical protein
LGNLVIEKPGREWIRMMANNLWPARPSAAKLFPDRDTATLREGQFASLELIIVARLLPLLSLIVVTIRSH